MAEEKTNNPAVSPEGQETVETGTEIDYSKLSRAELKKMAIAESEGKVVEPEKPEATTEVEKEKAEKEKVGKEKVGKKEVGKEEKGTEKTDDELLGDMKGKSIEEITKAYIGMRKLQSTQTDELGDLRKYKKTNEELNEQIKDYGINATAQKLVEKEVKEMTQAESDEFYEVFSKNPAKALMPLIKSALQPIYKKQGKTDNEAVIKDLIEAKKDTYVPYDRTKVNKILAGFTDAKGKNELFDRLGSKAFEEAYNIYYKENIEDAINNDQKGFKEKAVKEAEELARKKKKIFTEKQGVSFASAGTDTDYENMDKAELDKLVGKPKDTGGIKPI